MAKAKYYAAVTRSGRRIGMKGLRHLRQYIIDIGKGRAEPLIPESIREEKDLQVLAAIREDGHMYE
jgi:hypothetical protein